jgi:hypothetical protein
MVSITVTPTTPAASVSDTGVLTINGTATTTYVFDAVLELEHEQRLEKTHHPVQTGADISSHAYLMPARCVMYILMSDAVDSYSHSAANAVAKGNSIITPWIGTSTSKSVNAYQTIIGLQAARQPLTVTTRLRTYTNMVITSVSPREDYKTIAGLRMRVEFEQIFTASVSTQPVSARPNDTQSSGLGAVNPSQVPASTQSQFQQPQANATSTALTNSVGLGGIAAGLSTIAGWMGTNVPGAGSYSSIAGQQGAPLL